ncbi:N-acetyltransferase [Paractinoplanes abujensis]|uniref:Ribosomal protein S18 acetylase RimI-like enzyme n=1 Tax=Paractinoplanes abujensis TaxID=882441 RepID=A0A7W7CY04_9ACTN|nr:GNAT family N-acetyltransferase [Actinoplanes abujensis]MBB4696764.1 ribosomal protein S18 acetylase RimI-like enzyme [Actinoplanes abujensis]GID18772.1 N-acetyltransferase [Actinoplanes abujensis]
MTELPDGWSTRRPTLDDQPALLELVHASDIAAVGYPDYSPEDLHEALTEPNTDLSRDSWVALDPDGRIVGWAYPSNATGENRDFIEVYTWPERGRPAIRPLLDLILARAAERGAEFGHNPYEVRAGAVPSETAYIEQLTAVGFSFLKQHARMQIPLDGVSATPPEPPAGVTIRAVRADDEAEMRAVHGVIEQAFVDSDHRALPYDAWRKQVSALDEWWVAEVDGVVAGALESSYDSDEGNDEGWVKRLAVLGSYRKRGLGEALLRRAFATYAAKGRAKAGLGVDMANPTRAARLYLAVGMKPLYEANIYQKMI